MSKLSGEVADQQLAQWKEKYGKVFTYKVDDKIGYFRPVDRTTYALAASKVATSPSKFAETVIQQTWLGGDEDIKKLDDYYFGLIDFVEELMAKKKGSLGEI